MEASFIKIFEYFEKYVFTGHGSELYMNIPQLNFLELAIIILDLGLHVLITAKKNNFSQFIIFPNII